MDVAQFYGVNILATVSPGGGCDVEGGMKKLQF